MDKTPPGALFVYPQTIVSRSDVEKPANPAWACALFRSGLALAVQTGEQSRAGRQDQFQGPAGGAEGIKGLPTMARCSASRMLRPCLRQVEI